MEHHFNVGLATIYGIEGAIMIHNLHFWIKHKVANNKHFHDGRYWVFNSAGAFSELFPYMSSSKIYRILKGLEEKGFIIKGNYNIDKHDRTSWYSFTDDALGIMQCHDYDIGGFSSTFQNDELHFSKTENGNCENEKCYNIDYYIKETNSKQTDSKQEEKNIDKSISQKKAEFEHWWSLYDLKKGRAKCLAKWLRLSDVERSLCIANTPKYVASTPNKQYRKHPLTYLNGECWNDEVVEMNNYTSPLPVGMILSGNRDELIAQSKKDIW